MKALALPRFDMPNYFNTVLVNPKTGKFEKHGFCDTVLMGGVVLEKVYPSLKQLKKIRDDIDRYIQWKESKGENNSE